MTEVDRLDRRGVKFTYFTYSDAHALLILKTLIKAAPSKRMITIVRAWFMFNVLFSAFVTVVAIVEWLYL